MPRRLQIQSRLVFKFAFVSIAASCGLLTLPVLTLQDAYERAQKNANDFSVLPDEELATEMAHLEKTEQEAIEEANREREEIIQSKFTVATFLLFFECQRCSR